MRDLVAVLEGWLADLDGPDGPDDEAGRAPPAELASGWSRTAMSVTAWSGCSSSRAAVVPDTRRWYGLRTDGIDDFLAVVETHGRYEPRAEMEVDPSFKQIIPYLVLRDGERYFLMRRTRPGGDARLHDRWSIGVGGHIEPGDEGWPAGCAANGTRSSSPISSPPSRLPLCSTTTRPRSEPSTSASSCSPTPTARPVSVRETDKLSGAFATPAEVAAGADHLETWSRIVFDALEACGRDVGTPMIRSGRWPRPAARCRWSACAR